MGPPINANENARILKLEEGRERKISNAARTLKKSEQVNVETKI